MSAAARLAITRGADGAFVVRDGLDRIVAILPLDPADQRPGSPGREDVARANADLFAGAATLVARLQEALAGAPESDPGEGDWEDIQTAFGCGELAGQFDVADRVRAVLNGATAARPAMVRKVMVCSHCGGDQVRRDADAMWNVAAQQWELAGLYDKGSTCDTCGGECRIVERLA